MHYPFFMTRRGIVVALLAAAISLPNAAMAIQATTLQDDEDELSNEIVNLPERDTGPGLAPGSVLAVPNFSPTFTTREDARAFWDMVERAYSSPLPDPQSVARAFIKEQLGIDGDDYVVAHFATPMTRLEGSADSAITLTAALMNAFPEHSKYTFFGRLAGTVSVLLGGGRGSSDDLNFANSVSACPNARECFLRIGRFLWNSSVSGHIYNTFVGEGNVFETAADQLRPLDEAFGIFPKTSSFLPEHASSLLLSEVVGKFKEEGVFSELPYIKRLKSEFDRYWAVGKDEWPMLARYRFIELARKARARGVLTQEQYELVMKGGAPAAPLEGPITLRQLRNTPPVASVKAKRFDINGYAASNIIRFVAVDGSEVMYVPGSRSPFVVFRNEGELRAWVVRQAGNRWTLHDLLSHFSIYNSQDGVFWTGVAQGLAHLADARWTPDGRAIDASDGVIRGDVFEDMRVQTEARVRDDARMQTRTAWDAWRSTLTRTATVLGPLGVAPPLAIPIQAGSALIGMGTGIEEGINGRTLEERKSAVAQMVMTAVVNGVAVAASGSSPTSAEGGSGQVSVAFRPPQRVNGRIGYVMGPTKPPRLQSTAREGGQGAVAAGDEGALAASAEEESGRRRLFDPLIRSDPGQRGGAPAQGYAALSVPSDALSRTARVIELKKALIDDTRQRLDEFRTESLATTSTGARVSFDKSIVYRVDDRTPQQLLANNGFGASMHFYDIGPMLRQSVTIGSGSLEANNVVFRNWQDNFPFETKFNQYAIWTEGRTVASAADNYHPNAYDFHLDEVHFPADVPASNIYIIDSFNPSYAKAIAEIYESAYVSTPYGVPLEAFVEYLAGRLDINAPNRFTPRRMDSLSLPQGASGSESGSGSALSVPYQSISPADISHSEESAPLLPSPAPSEGSSS